MTCKIVGNDEIAADNEEKEEEMEEEKGTDAPGPEPRLPARSKSVLQCSYIRALFGRH